MTPELKSKLTKLVERVPRGYRAAHKYYVPRVLHDVLGLDWPNKTVYLEVNGEPEMWDMDRCWLIQDTGLEDVNGNPIYEGDALYAAMPCGENYIVERSDAGYHPFVDGTYASFEVEIIGNVFTNPNLFEEIR